MQQNMNTNQAFVTDGRLHDKPVPTLVLQDCMGVVKAVRRHIPGRNMLVADEAMPTTLPLATASNVLLRPLLASFERYSRRAERQEFVMVLCFDYYGVENAAKTVCHELRDARSESDPEDGMPPLVQDAYITDWDQPLPEEWDQLLASRAECMPIVLRDITKAIVRLQHIAPGQKLIVCGHSLDSVTAEGLAQEQTNERRWTVPVLPDAEIRVLPLVLEHDRAYFDPQLRVEQIEGDLQIFSLLRTLARREQDIVHIISKDTDVMYYALWYAASEGTPQIRQLLWKHQWSRNGDSWVDIYRLCESIGLDRQLGSTKFQQAVKNLVVCLVATGTDYTSGYHGVGHVKWMKSPQAARAPLFGNRAVSAGEKRKAEQQQPEGLNHEAYHAWANAVVGPKRMLGNQGVVDAMAQHLDYYIRRLLQSVGSPAQPDHVNMEDFMFHGISKRRLYSPQSSSSSKDEEEVLSL